MKKTLTALGLGLAVLTGGYAITTGKIALPTQAAHASDYKAVTAETEAAIRKKLTEAGYEVFKIKAEDGMYEAYAKMNGEKLEVYLDQNLEIVKIKADD